MAGGRKEARVAVGKPLTLLGNFACDYLAERQTGPLDSAGSISYKPRTSPKRLAGAYPSPPRFGASAQVAQLVEHATENRSVGGSIPPLGTTYPSKDVRESPRRV